MRFEFNTLLEMNLSHQFDATLGAWGIDTSLDLKYAFHSDSIDQGYNYGGYHNVEVDRLIDVARDLAFRDVLHPQAVPPSPSLPARLRRR